AERDRHRSADYDPARVRAVHARRSGKVGPGYQDHRNQPELRSTVKTIVLLALLLASPVMAQPYPSHPVRMIVPYAVGGASDVTARIVAAHLGERLKQPIVVDNRTGAGGAIGA